MLTLLLLSLLWGSAFLMNDYVVEGFEPFTVVAGRLAIAGLALSTVLLMTGRSLPARSNWALLVVIAVVNNVAPFTLITWAQQHIESSLAATLIATMPLITFVIAAAMGAEAPTPEKGAGVVVGFIGAAVLIGPSLDDVTSSSALGELAVVAASLCYALGTIISREWLRGEPVALAWGQIAIGAVVAAPLALLFEGVPDGGAPASAWTALAGLGLFSSAAAYILFFSLIQRMPATNVAIVSYLIPVVATLLGWLVLGEDIGLSLLLGLALIVGGMMAVNGSARAWLTRAPRSEAPAAGG